MLWKQVEGDTFSSPLLMFGHFSNHNDASLNLRVQKKKRAKQTDGDGAACDMEQEPKNDWHWRLFVQHGQR